MSKQWFRFYPGDYLRDTQLLTPEEHGCYMLMIMHYYSTGKPLPADRFVLSKIFKVSPQKTCKILSTISQLFVKKDGCFYHPKIERELKKSKEIQRVKSEAALKRWHAHADAYGDAIPEPEPEPYKEKKNTKKKKSTNGVFKPPSIDEVKDRCEHMGYSVSPEYFHAFYESKGWMVGRNKMKSWTSALAGWEARNKQEKPAEDDFSDYTRGNFV